MIPNIAPRFTFNFLRFSNLVEKPQCPQSYSVLDLWIIGKQQCGQILVLGLSSIVNIISPSSPKPDNHDDEVPLSFLHQLYF